MGFVNCSRRVNGHCKSETSGASSCGEEPAQIPLIYKCGVADVCRCSWWSQSEVMKPWASHLGCIVPALLGSPFIKFTLNIKYCLASSIVKVEILRQSLGNCSGSFEQVLQQFLYLVG